MATVPLYDNAGKEIGTLPLPDSIFGVEFNEGLVHQAIVTEEANMRQGTHDTKGRSEVRGGGRKPWKQKGTGRARQGSIRAPQWRKGGIVEEVVEERIVEKIARQAGIALTAARDAHHRVDFGRPDLNLARPRRRDRRLEDEHLIGAAVIVSTVCRGSGIFCVVNP